MTDENEDLVELLDNDHLDSTQLATKIDKVMQKIKFKSFGKVTIKKAKEEDKELVKLYEKRKDFIENKKDEKVKEVEEEISKQILQLQRSSYED